MGLRAVSASFLLLWVLCTGAAFAQKKGGGQGSGGNQNGGGSPSQNGSSAQGSQQGNNTAPNGITGGSSSIESTLFSYKALTADAQAISQEVSDITTDQDLIVIVTPSDAAGFVQWRTVLQQLHTLQQRAATRPRAQDVTLPTYSKAQPTPPSKHAAGEAYVASSQDIQTLIQTLATMFAVNESVSPSMGAITDVPLVNTMARDLSGSQLNVYIPSLYTPSLFQRGDLANTFIGQDLSALERSRLDIASDIQAFQSAIDIANTITKQGVTAGYTANDVKTAKAFLDSRSSEMKTLIAGATALVAAMDTFEASLFTGQSPATQSTNVGDKQANGQGGPVQTPPADGNANPTQTPSQNANSPVPSLNFTNTPGNTLQQILPADLLAYKIWQANATPDDPQLRKIHILMVHALESGGTQLSKSNLFLGSRVYFSGGAVATFSMFTTAGAIECAGYAYDYSGYVREKNVQKQLHVGKSDSAVLDTVFPCN